MKNRAKCKVCSSIIESFFLNDYVVCKCSEISITGGNTKFECSAKNWDNFLRIDDEGNEIQVKIEVKESLENVSTGVVGAEKHEEKESDEYTHKLSRKELLDMLHEMIKNIEKLPEHAMSLPINHYDFSSLLILLLAIFKDDCISDN